MVRLSVASCWTANLSRLSLFGMKIGEALSCWCERVRLGGRFQKFKGVLLRFSSGLPRYWRKGR
jgi:hypothetical protein